MKIIVCGPDLFDEEDEKMFFRALDNITKKLKSVEILTRPITEGGRIIERLAHQWCFKNRKVYYIHYSDGHSKEEKHERNRAMVLSADGLIALDDGKTHYVKDLIKLAKAAGLKVKVLEI